MIPASSSLASLPVLTDTILTTTTTFATADPRPLAALSTAILTTTISVTSLAPASSAPSLSELLEPTAADSIILAPTMKSESSTSLPTAFVPPASAVTSSTSASPFAAFPASVPPSVVSVADSGSSITTETEEGVAIVTPASKSLRNKLHVDNAKFADNLPLVVGHRGAPFLDLENTRSGFEKCAQMGCDAVELDVFVLKCGTLIVFHGGGTDEDPGDLLDYCNRRGNILDLTYEEALKLQFNPDYDEFPCPDSNILMGSIPTLEQVLLDAKKTGLFVKIELKGENTVEPTLEVVDRLDMVGQVSFASFDLGRVARLRELRPEISPVTGKHLYPSGALYTNQPPADFLETCARIGADEIHLQYDVCTVEMIQRIHDAGFGSMAWFRGPIGMTNDTTEKYWDIGNEDMSCYDLFRRTGVQQMCVNRPDVLIDVLKGVKGEHSIATM